MPEEIAATLRERIIKYMGKTKRRSRLDSHLVVQGSHLRHLTALLRAPRLRRRCISMTTAMR
ncbi:hypothetical protein [Pseudomonas sp. Irchel 3H3]|uniref:hypothetical protein n=1 Tax=Pseudomonas sp. Irchel 3H3 TaxID=2009038 RepID=UPI001358D1E1|nr:hypothetical protein [Pseudomonas sp. Irchel 3H3]